MLLLVTSAVEISIAPVCVFVERTIFAALASGVPFVSGIPALGSAIPVLGSVAAGGLVETFDDVHETLDLNDVLARKGVLR